MIKKNRIKSVASGINRRDALGLLGLLSAGGSMGLAGGLSAGCGSSSDSSANGSGVGGAPDGMPTCVLTAEATEGPFFVEEKLNRSDLLVGESDAGITAGYPLTVTLTVLGINGASCGPLPNATVDVWHANVPGLYSDEPSNFVQSTDTTGKKYLRGFQITDQAGQVTFKTIYPGWYATRTIHIHVKVRLYSAAGDKTLEANAQLYFADAMNDAVLALPDYAARGPRSIPKNTKDQVYNGTGPGSGIDNVGLPSGQVPPGEQTLAAVTAFSAAAGSSATLTIAVKLA